MIYKKNLELFSSYEKVSSKFKKSLNFEKDLIEKSRDIFEINNNIAIPKKLEVIALLGGLPFSEELQESISLIQNKLHEILKNNLSYMVKKENLGLELLVLKWPKDKRDYLLEKKIIEFLNTQDLSEFDLFFDGIQIHNDGCIILRGFDSDNKFISLRKIILSNFPEIPKKQSNWVHIPIGRILTQVSREVFNKLQGFVEFTQLNSDSFPTQKISTIKMIHEKQWYMEKRKTIKTWHLK